MAALQSQLRGLTRGLRDNLRRFVLPEARPTGRSLGTGSYGSVEEVEVNGMICAGKKIHEALLDAGNFGVQVIARKYAEECQLMTEMRHPHVVQFIGICFRAESALPLLVMERLETSLDDLLETTPDIPLTIKRSVLEGTARGLLYLHQRNPPVIHRDLTAKNILLTSSLEAKITDFGNSRMVDLQPGRLGTLSRLPGTLVYMPPEALADRARYGPSLDVFSFGHCALFICTQVFPGDLKSSTYPDPANAERTLARSEVERREDYISQLEQQLAGGSRHPLVALIRQCLHNAPDRRPTTEGLIEQLVTMRAAIEGPYGDMVVKLDVARVGMSRALRSREAQLRELQQQMAQLETDKEAAEARVEGQAAELRERTAQVDTLQRQVRAKDDQIRANIDHIRARDDEIRARDGEIRARDGEIRAKDDQIRASTTQLQQLRIDSSAKDNQLQLKDREIASKASEIRQLQRSRDSLRAELAGREEQLSRQGAELQPLTSRLREQEASPRRKMPGAERITEGEDCELIDKSEWTQDMHMWYDRCDRVIMLVVGKYTAGKSTLINALLGEEKAFVNFCKREPTTRDVFPYEKKFDKGVTTVLFDSPGLSDVSTADDDQKHIKKMRAACPEVHLVIICVRMDYRYGDGYKNVLRVLTAAFGKDIWKHVVIILTQANNVKSMRPTDDAKQFFLHFYTEKKNELRKYLKHELRVVFSVPVVAAGHPLDHTLPVCEDWRVKVLTKCILRASEEETFQLHKPNLAGKLATGLGSAIAGYFSV